MISRTASNTRSTCRSRRLMRARAVWTLATLLVLSPGLRASAQVAGPNDSRVPTPTTRVGLEGPRFGVTVLDPGSRNRLAEQGIHVAPIISQFGWQFERVFLGEEQAGPIAVTELVLLAGGLDQGTIVPSGSWLIGVRGTRGAEFGVGPNVTPGGVALAIAGGITKRAGSLNIPFNLAVVPAKNGVRISVLGGFTIR